MRRYRVSSVCEAMRHSRGGGGRSCDLRSPRKRMGGGSRAGMLVYENRESPEFCFHVFLWFSLADL